jgi:NAD(P)-dependent dehydrogenase (short-subunit alcohol dehydrogenase family)
LLARRNVHVCLADIDGSRAEAAARDLDREGPGTAESAAVDVSDAAAVTDLIESVHRRHGWLDYLFNQAGIGVFGEPEELTLAHWERVIDVNVRGVIHGCHAAYPLMRQQGFGHLVNTASMVGLVPGFGQQAAYGMTKHAVVGLSLGLRAAGADAGVRVHVVCPGVIDTPMLDTAEVPGLPTPPSVAGVDPRADFRELGLRKLYPPRRLAQDILRGVDRNRAVIIAPRQARMICRVARYAPRVTRALSLKHTRQLRRRRSAGAR